MDRAARALGPVLTPRTKRTKGKVPRKRRDLELEAGARAHFEDPAYYASTYASRKEDVAFYAAVARGHASVLEYGIGNGRIALPIARAGSRVVGIDHTRAMIDDLRTRLEGEPPEVRKRVRARLGDMRRARVDERFPLVIAPFNAVQHLYTRQDMERWLARVDAHLTPRGELVFDVGMPVLEDLTRDPHKAHRMPPFVHPSAGRVKYHELFDYDRVRQILFVSMFFEPAPTRSRASSASSANAAESFMTPLAHRQFFPCELEALLHYNGFETVAMHGDFEGAPLTQTSDAMIVRARRRRTR